MECMYKNRLVATIDFDNRRISSPGTCSCCEGDGEVKTVIVKCFDQRRWNVYVGEHSLTYMEYNKCFCTTCGRKIIYHNDDGGHDDDCGGHHDSGGGDDDDDGGDNYDDYDLDDSGGGDDDCDDGDDDDDDEDDGTG